MLEALLSTGAGLLQSFFGRNERDQERAAQREAAQNSVQWRVADAKKAGIHPLAALGMQPISLAPVNVGGDPSWADMGQDLGRAVAAGSTVNQRVDQMSRSIVSAQLEGLNLDNDIKRAELASRVRRNLLGAGVPPVVPEVGPNTARGADIGGQTLPLPGGKEIKSGRTATSEEIERQYGDVAQSIYGIGRMVDDSANNAFPGVNWDRFRMGNVLRELFGITPAY